MKLTPPPFAREKIYEVKFCVLKLKTFFFLNVKYFLTNLRVKDEVK